MKTIKIFFFLLLFYTICSQILEIENGQTIEVNLEGASSKTIIYNFTVPESETYENAIIVYNGVFDDDMLITLDEDGEKSNAYSRAFIYHSLSSIQNKTITFTITKMYGSYGKFTLLDLTKEINTTLDNLINLVDDSVDYYLLPYTINPVCIFRYNIEKVNSDQTFFFKNQELSVPLSPVGNGLVEYCSDEDCLNNTYYASKVIEFKKGSKYKMKINYAKYPYAEYYFYLAFYITKYSEPIKLNKGAHIYNIEKTNLDHYYIIDWEDINSFGLYSKSYKYFRYAIATKDLVDNLPFSLEEMEFSDYSLYDIINITSNRYAIIILKDNELYEKNVLFLYNKLVSYNTSFVTFTLYKGYYAMIRLIDNNYKYFFTSVESSKPSLKLIEDIESFEKNELSTQIVNQKIVYACNEDEDVNIKIRFYHFEKDFNHINSINNDKLDNYLDEYGNSDSLFLRWKSNDLNYYGFATLIAFDLTSEYYLYFKEYYGNLNVYKYPIDDNTNLTSLLIYIKSYKDDYRFTLINNNLVKIDGSKLFSTYLSYGFFGDIYIQKVNDDQNIKLNNNDTTGNLVKLLISEKIYNIDFNLNHLIKLDIGFSDAIVTFYDDNNNEIGSLDIHNRTIELSGENIKIKSDKNALVYFYSVMSNEKKLYEIIFDKEKIGQNMHISIANLNSDNETVIFIKDYGFENHYPMLSSNNWDKILIGKKRRTYIFIENPYDRLQENELDENEVFIIYIANAYDENGRPYFEEENFQIREISYKKNLYSKYNKFDFQVVELDKEGSIILSQSNKNRIKYEMTVCNSLTYYFKIEHSNYNVSTIDTSLSSNRTYSEKIQNNEIMSHSLYPYNNNQGSVIFYYNFDNNVQSNLLSLSDVYENTYNYIIALDENHLEISFKTYRSDYFRFYIVVALVDDINNLSSFNQYCYLTKLITENTNTNYSLNIIYDEFTHYYLDPHYTVGEIDISNLKANKNSKLVLNIINEYLFTKSLEFNYAIEFIPEMIDEIELYKSYQFNAKRKNYFRYNHSDPNLKEFILVVNSGSYSTLTINIKGPEIYEEYTKLKSNNVYFNLTKPGIVYIKFDKDEISGSFYFYPLKKTIDIDLKEKIYFYKDTFQTDKKDIIFVYHVTNLTEDKLVYFYCSQTQFEICDISSKNCNFVASFYKFLANKEYFINVYSYDESSSSGKRYMKPYVFGIFDKENIKIYNNLGVDKNNEPRIYLVEKKYVSSLYFININTNLSFYAKASYETDEIFNQLQNINFNKISTTYNKFDFSDDLLSVNETLIFLVFPNFNFESIIFENSVIGCSNTIFLNKGKNEQIEISPNENAFIIIQRPDDYNYRYSIKSYYNHLRIIKSQNNNLALVDINNSFDKLSDTLILNSRDNHSEYIYIDKKEDNNIIRFFYYSPRYTYFYAVDDEVLKNRTKFIKENGGNSYFKRQSSEIDNFKDIFHKITFDLENKVNIYFKKYYGNSNIYEINLESYDFSELSFLTMPLKTYENEKSILNQLFTLESNKLYSGFRDYQTLYDIYIDIDNEDNIVKMQQKDNPFNNLIKLFKPNINYILDFEVNHLIKLEPNFNAEVTIIDSEKTIKLNKNNPITTEIKGNNVKIITDSKAILYFYNSISTLRSTSQIYKNLFQYEIEPKNEKNLYIDIEINGDTYVYMHYLIDVGFEGYAPLEYQTFNTDRESCSRTYCSLYFPNYYDKLKTELVEGEKLFVYYYLESSKNLKTNHNATYYSSLKNINNKYTFFVIPPNIEGEEEKNLVINFYNKEDLNLQAYYCPNNDGTKPILNYYEAGTYKRTITLDESRTYTLDYWSYKTNKFNFTSNNEFIFSFSFDDKYDEIIRWDDWNYDRKIMDNLEIKKAEIDFNTNIANIQFTPNYINSTTKYFIIIGPKNDTFNIDSFNNPCFLIKLITENSVGAKIYEVMSIGDENIDINIDISDLISQNSENKVYVVNIVSLEIRFDKRLNFYKSKLFGKPIQVHINEDINFDGENLFYKLEYSRPNNVSELCMLIPKSVSSDYEIIIENPNLEERQSNVTKNFLSNLPFECTSDGSYSIKINTLLKGKSVQGSFQIISTGIPLDFDLSEYFYNYFYIFGYINYQPSPLTLNINGSKLDQDILIHFNYSDIKILIQDENSNNMTFNNIFFFLEKNKNYKVIFKFNKPDENEYLTYIDQIIPFLDYNFEELSFGTKNYTGILCTFLKICYKNTPIIKFESDYTHIYYHISYISESDYNIFPKKIEELEFNYINDTQTIKPNDYDYAILLFFADFNNISVTFIDGRTHLDIELDSTYNIEDIFTIYDLNFDSNKEDEIFILFYDFYKEYSGEIIIKTDGYNNMLIIDNKLKGSIYFEVPTKKKYEFYFNNLEQNSGKFKIISTGNLFEKNLIRDLMIFDEMISQKETSPLIFSFDLLDKDHIIKVNINNEDPSKIFSVKKDDESIINSVNNYYILEKDTKYIVQINPIKKQDIYVFEKVDIQPIDENNIINLKMGNITFTDKIDKFIKINYTEFSSFEIINTIGEPQYAIANLYESQYNDFPLNINTIKFNKINDTNIKKHANNFYSILIIYLNDEKTELLFNKKIGPSYADFNSEYNIDKDHYSFLINYEKPSTYDEIVIVNYDFNENKPVKVFIERASLDDKIIEINNRQKGTFNFNVKDNGELMISFEEIVSNNNNEESFSGTFKLILTGKEFIIDIEQNIIEFDEIKTTIQTSPLIFTFGLLENNYIKKLNVETDDPSKIISIKKNDEDYIPINNFSNYYTFENNTIYSIQLNFKKIDENYLLNKVNFVEFSENNIVLLNESNKIVYKEIDVDKFILFNFNKFSKLKVNQKNGSAIFNKAIINETQYNIFPIEIQNIEFERMENNNNIEIKKEKNCNFGVLMVSLKEKNTEIEFKLENDNKNKKNSKLSTFEIVMICVSCFIFLAIAGVVIIIVLRKRRNSRETEARFKSLKKDLVEMSGNDEEQNKEN